MKLSIIVPVLALLLIFSSDEARGDDPIEYQLAVIDAGDYVPRDHITVKRFRSLLKQLDATYVENRQQIGDMTVTAQRLLREEGIDEKLLNIMEGLNRLFSKPLENQKYAEYSVMYITLREKGYSHGEAIDSLKAILESMGIY